MGGRRDEFAVWSEIRLPLTIQNSKYNISKILHDLSCEEKYIIPFSLKTEGWNAGQFKTPFKIMF